MLLIARPGAEPHVALGTGDAIAGQECPQAGDPDRVAVVLAQRPLEVARPEAVDVDDAVPEVADQQRTREVAEPLRRERHPPWGVERTAPDQPLRELALARVHVDEPMVRTGHVIVGTGT